MAACPSSISAPAPLTSVRASGAARIARTRPPKTSSRRRRLRGLERETDFIKVEASAAFDWRNNPAYPQSGGRYEVTATRVR